MSISVKNEHQNLPKLTYTHWKPERMAVKSMSDDDLQALLGFLMGKLGKNRLFFHDKRRDIELPDTFVGVTSPMFFSIFGDDGYTINKLGIAKDMVTLGFEKGYIPEIMKEFSISENEVSYPVDKLNLQVTERQQHEFDFHLSFDSLLIRQNLKWLDEYAFVRELKFACLALKSAKVKPIQCKVVMLNKQNGRKRRYL
jgi:hypothetical protein